MARTFDWRVPRTPDGGVHERWLYRYADTQCVGAQAWMRFIEALAPQFPHGGLGNPTPPTTTREPPLATFLNNVRALRKRRRPRRLYIAYQQADSVEAKRLAHLASSLGMAYWLDAYDSLRHESEMQSPGLAGTLVAASIEMGLLNCSHAVIVADRGASGIDWSAYQVARAREHSRLARSHALWLDEHATGFELAALGEVLHGERALWRWLHGQPAVQPVPGNHATENHGIDWRHVDQRRLRPLRPFPLREREVGGRGQLTVR